MDSGWDFTALISIHAPPRGATCTKRRSCLRILLFQFTPLREGRHTTTVSYGANREFQFTPLREGRHKPHMRYTCLKKISIHAPPRGATSASHSEMASRIFQFTPLREGRRPRACRAAQHTISIHAPPRGATYRNYATQEVNLISIHAPPRGATRANQRNRQHRPHFNSRPSARGDSSIAWTKAGTKVISIHAPPRGATRVAAGATGTVYISIHAPPRGATPKFGRCYDERILFQFTPLREGRRASGSTRS